MRFNGSAFLQKAPPKLLANARSFVKSHMLDDPRGKISLEILSAGAKKRETFIIINFLLRIMEQNTRNIGWLVYKVMFDFTSIPGNAYDRISKEMRRLPEVIGDELRRDVEYPLLQRLENPGTIERIKQKARICEEGEGHRVYDPNTRKVNDKIYIAGVCERCRHVVIKEMTPEIERKITKISEIERRIRETPITI